MIPQKGRERRSSLRDFLYLVFRQKRKMLAVFLTVVITVTVASLITPPSYRASAKILVKFGRENVYTNTSSAQPIVDQARQEQIHSEMEILKARVLAEKVIRQIGVSRIYPDADKKSFLDVIGQPATALQKALLQFQRRLSVDTPRKSNIIHVHFEHRDPGIASEAVNRVVDEFIGQHVTAYKQPDVSNFFDEQTRRLEKSLQSAEARLQSFRDRHSISSLQEQKVVLLRQISETELELSKVRAEISEHRGKKSSLESSPASPSQSRFGKETDYNVQAISSIKNNLNVLRLKEQELLAKYPPHNHLVVSIKKEIEKAEQLLAHEEETYHKKEVRTIDHTLQALQQKERTQRGALSRYQAEIQRINGIESQLKELERQSRINEDNYQLYSKKAEEGKLSDAMDNRRMANISIIQPAMTPLKPVKPNVALNVMISIILGAFAAVGVAFSSESFNRNFKTKEDVQRYLGLPVLAALGEMKHQD